MIPDNSAQKESPLTYKWGTRLNLTFLIIHIGFFILFSYMQVWIMTVLNIFSILLYTINFLFFRYRPYTAITLIYIELLAHYLIAVQCFGWNAGFQNSCFTSIIVAYFIGYALKEDGYDKFNPNFFAAISLIIFLICWIESEYDIQYYSLTVSASKTMHFVNDILNLIIIGEFARVFTITFLTEKDMLIHTAEVDALTGLSNRHYINRICNFFHFGEKNGQREYAVAIIDIDNFKMVNDTYGHNTGDYVLKTISNVLKPSISRNVIIGRWGGEEFIIICVGTDSYDILKDLAEIIRDDIQNTTMDFEENHFNVTVSIGIHGTIQGEKYVNVFEKADANLYKAKKTGKNKVVFS